MTTESENMINAFGCDSARSPIPEWAGHIWALIHATENTPSSHEDRGSEGIPPLPVTISSIHQVLAQMSQAIPGHRTIISCERANVIGIAREFLSVPTENIILEPHEKGTGPITILVATLLARRDPDAVVISFAGSSPKIDGRDLLRTLRVAIVAAQLGWIICIANPPSNSSSDLGYIFSSSDPVVVSDEGNLNRIDGFISTKQNLTNFGALRQFDIYVNSGIFVWKASELLREVAYSHPILAKLGRQLAGEWDRYDFEEVSRVLWSAQDFVSAEKDIFVTARKAAVAPPAADRELPWHLRCS